MTTIWKNFSLAAFTKSLLANVRLLISKLKNFIKSSMTSRAQIEKDEEIEQLKRRVENLEKVVYQHVKIMDSLAKSYPITVKAIGDLAAVQSELAETVVNLSISVKKLDSQASQNLINLFQK